ncbi:TetR family transcriptional regulator [Arthrobacter sp. MYb227]|uniref:TetR/AcrR family transcriptional regulator n=1 Tax=Arthrobacter sp. MYb227 TaxID=1848601 RepID=UPI000CFD8BBE|nr:TetR/AcrR family transcriptional regulator [Arthrobacter sp. MYb227]PQZ93621.1 TetR family transcriptional regulator [Arthrobacter sp. MYb227]
MQEIRSPRELARERTMAEIMRLAREQLASHGAAALSLRAVAKDLGIVSSAVYRYVASRDELLTLLVVEAYSDLGDAVDTALKRAPLAAEKRFVLLARAVRAWAIAEPARYGLLFGTPVPGYHAPAGQTVEAGTRVVVRLMGIIEDAWNAGDITASPTVPSLSPGLAADVEALRTEYDLNSPGWLIARGLGVWSALFGAVSFEVFGQYGPNTLSDASELFELSMRVLAANLGFRG